MRPARPHCGQEGGLDPLLSITPAGGCLRLPATANKFVHILWKNLICDNVAAVQLRARSGRRGCCRCQACACRFREGDAPAGCRYRARDAHPYGVSAVSLTLIRQMGGRRKAPLIFVRAARPEGKELIRKKGKTARLSPSCAPAAHSRIPIRDARAHAARSGTVSPGARCAPLR